MKEVIEGEFAFGIEYGNAYIQKKNGEIIWLDQLASQFYNHGPVRLTIEPLPVAPQPPAPIKRAGFRCSECKLDGFDVCKYCFEGSLFEFESPAPGPGASDSNGGGA